MARKSRTKPALDTVVAFKVEPALAELLDKLPNKSAFIRKAIAAQLGVACPLCQGKGVVPRGLHDHYAPLLTRFKSRSCACCGHGFSLPRHPAFLDPETLCPPDPFILGRPLYCD